MYIKVTVKTAGELPENRLIMRRGMTPGAFRNLTVARVALRAMHLAMLARSLAPGIIYTTVT